MTNHIAPSRPRKRKRWLVVVKGTMRQLGASPFASERGHPDIHSACNSAADVLEAATRNGFTIFVSIKPEAE